MRKPTNLQRLLTLLRDGRWHTGDELAQITFRFGHTVFEAKRKGYEIEKRRVAHNRYEYRLTV